MPGRYLGFLRVDEAASLGRLVLARDNWGLPGGRPPVLFLAVAFTGLAGLSSPAEPPDFRRALGTDAPTLP